MVKRNQNSIKKIFMIILITLSYFNINFPSDNNIFVLKKETAIKFFKNINENSAQSEEHRVYKVYIKENDLLSYLNEVDYFCWKKIDDRDYIVLIPDIPNKRIIRGLGDELVNKIEKDNNYLITKEKMYAISLRMLMINKPDYFEQIMKCCNIPENISMNMVKFYIMEFLKDRGNSLRIYSCYCTNNNKYELRNPKKSLSQKKFDDCIKKWEDTLKINPTKSAEQKIKVRIVGLIGGRDIYQICAGNPIRIKYGNFTITSYSQFDQIIENTEISNIPIDLDLLREEDIKKISSESIYYAYRGEFKIITYNSFYNDIWDHYYNTRENFFNKTVNLFYIRTSNFEPGETNANALAAELNRVRELVQDIVRNRSRITKIKAIGYADRAGTEEGNKELSSKRAKSVTEWLKSNIGNMQGKIVYLEALGCDKKYYTEEGFNDRSVEIKIY